ncbi:glycosyltransferase [Prosthecomicrobium pneumaticum]|uniref:Glycosyltransferase involved in cell wall biosynthesis n=1 Tax=Prosthecomicrobium pneumaticum TaxID=81895 RepID=A0A7W9FQD4_9HYPH|nr:glycosyltransferase involved in cell wall biosynthesis [Prosthecomicrobium pneumaticum]
MAIDVIVPVYGNAGTVVEALESVARQSVFADVVLTVADDASRDDSWERIRAWGAGRRNVRTFRNPANLGVMANYRRLLAECRGEFVAPLEADDIWLSDHRLERLRDHLERSVGAACFNGFIVDDLVAGEQRPDLLSAARRHRRLSTFDLIADNAPASFSNCFYRRPALAAAFDRAAGHEGYDWLVNTLIAAGHGGFDYWPEVLSSYRVHGDGTWSSLSKREKASLIEATLRTLRTLLPARYERAIERRLSNLEEYAGG